MTWWASGSRWGLLPPQGLDFLGKKKKSWHPEHEDVVEDISGLMDLVTRDAVEPATPLPQVREPIFPSGWSAVMEARQGLFKGERPGVCGDKARGRPAPAPGHC